MSRESFDVLTFDLGPLLQGQTGMAKLKTGMSKLESAYLTLIIAPTSLQGQSHCAIFTVTLQQKMPYSIS